MSYVFLSSIKEEIILIIYIFIMSIKKALLIGINYSSIPKYKLYGSINDVNNLQTFLVNGNYFPSSDITTMTDNSTGNLYPTKQNILLQFAELVTLATSNPNSTITYFLSFSGHGITIKDNNNMLGGAGQNECNMVDAIYPIDILTAGYITDVELKTNLINKLPANVKLSALIDTCCSGTVFNLKYNYAINDLNVYTIYGDMFQTNADVLLLSAAKDAQNAVEAVIGSTCKTNNRAVYYKPNDCCSQNICSCGCSNTCNSGGCGPIVIDQDVSCRRYNTLNTSNTSNLRKSGKNCKCKKSRRNQNILNIDNQNDSDNNGCGCGCNNNNNHNNSGCNNFIPTQFYQGVLSAAFVANYSDFISYYDLVKNIRTWTSTRGYNQQAQFSTGKFLNVKTTKKFFA